MSELKPCPFCGKDAQVRLLIGSDQCSHIECDYCHSRTAKYGAAFWSSKTWNKRPIEDALRAENERLKAEMFRLKDIEDAVMRTIDEPCRTDEVHCSCVPLLKAGTDMLNADNERLRDALRPFALIDVNLYATCPPADALFSGWMLVSAVRRARAALAVKELSNALVECIDFIDTEQMGDDQIEHEADKLALRMRELLRAKEPTT